MIDIVVGCAAVIITGEIVALIYIKLKQSIQPQRHIGIDGNDYTNHHRIANLIERGCATHGLFVRVGGGAITPNGTSYIVEIDSCST